MEIEQVIKIQKEIEQLKKTIDSERVTKRAIDTSKFVKVVGKVPSFDKTKRYYITSTGDVAYNEASSEMSKRRELGKGIKSKLKQLKSLKAQIKGIKRGFSVAKKLAAKPDQSVKIAKRKLKKDIKEARKMARKTLNVNDAQKLKDLEAQLAKL